MYARLRSYLAGAFKLPNTNQHEVEHPHKVNAYARLTCKRNSKYLPRISAIQVAALACNSASEKHSSSLTVTRMQLLIQDGAKKRIPYH